MRRVRERHEAEERGHGATAHEPRSFYAAKGLADFLRGHLCQQKFFTMKAGQGQQNFFLLFSFRV